MKNYSIRLDEDTRKQAQKVFDSLGMDFSTGIRIYLKQVIKHDGIPFEVTNDLPKLDKSIDEYKNGNYETFNNVDELFKDLNDED